MKIYIASHCKDLGSAAAKELLVKGHEVTSRWIGGQFFETERWAPEDRERIAQEDFDDVRSCDVLVLLAGPGRYSGGKFVEAGIAMGLGKEVVVIGRRENMLLWHPSVKQFESIQDWAKGAI